MDILETLRHEPQVSRLCIEEKEGIVRAFLQSVSLEEIIEHRVKTAIDQVIDGMPDDIAIIYK